MQQESAIDQLLSFEESGNLNASAMVSNLQNYTHAVCRWWEQRPITLTLTLALTLAIALTLILN